MVIRYLQCLSVSEMAIEHISGLYGYQPTTITKRHDTPSPMFIWIRYVHLGDKYNNYLDKLFDLQSYIM